MSDVCAVCGGPRVSFRLWTDVGPQLIICEKIAKTFKAAREKRPQSM